MSTTHLRDVLSSAGVPAAELDLLAARLASPSGTFAPAELHGASDGRVALLGAMVAAADFRRLGGSLRGLLAFLDRHQADLDDYDAGRLFHIRGFAAWRLEDALFNASHALNRSIRLLRAAGTPEATAYLARVCDTYGQVLAHQGLLTDARHELTLALALRRKGDDDAGIAITIGNLGRVCMDAGDWSAAAEYLAEDLVMAERDSPGATRILAMLRNQLATCMRNLGRVDEARLHLEASDKLAAAGGDGMGRAFAALGFGWLALPSSEQRDKAARTNAVEGSAEARAAVERAKSFIDGAEAQESFKEDVRAWVRHLEAHIELEDGDPERARVLFEETFARLARTRGMSPVEQATVLRGLARASLRCNSPRDASVQLRRALRLLDATAAESLRADIEGELRSLSPDAWLLHAAGRFMGQDHIELLLDEAGRVGFRGERKEVAVLFSDVRGFTSLSERMAPEDLVTLLNDLLGHMTRAIEGAGGFVDKFIGDAVMAVFSLPRTTDEDADRSVRGALQMLEELEGFNHRLPERIPNLALGVGIHFGSVVAGLIGSPQKRSYTVLGDTVNTASRLEGMTKQLGGTLLITEEIACRLKDRDGFLLRPLGAFSPKGRAGAITVFDVAGERDGTTAARAAEAEIERATAALEAFRAHRFTEAATKYRELQRDPTLQSHAPAYSLLAREADRLSHEAPPSSWRGEVHLTEK